MSPYFLMMFSWLYTQEKKVPLWLFFCVKTFICIPYQKSCVMNKLSLHSKKYRAFLVCSNSKKTGMRSSSIPENHTRIILYFLQLNEQLKHHILQLL